VGPWLNPSRGTEAAKKNHLSRLRRSYRKPRKSGSCLAQTSALKPRKQEMATSRLGERAQKPENGGAIREPRLESKRRLGRWSGLRPLACRVVPCSARRARRSTRSLDAPVARAPTIVGNCQYRDSVAKL